MRILHTNFLHKWGGQSNRILTVCRGLLERGHEVVIAAPSNSELIRRARDAGVETNESMRFVRGFRPIALVRDLRQMRRLLAEGRFDLVHTHGSQDSWLVAFANRQKRLPVVRTKHNIFPIQDHFANRWLYGHAFDRIICVADAIIEQCAAKPYIQRERLSMIHSAVDLERFRRLDQKAIGLLREEWGKDRKVVVIVGRVCPEKGHSYVVDAVASLKDKIPNILLAVVGDGHLRREVRLKAEKLGLAQHVRFLGFRTDVPEIFAAADLFVMPSLSEGIATAAIEASTVGCPIVASRVGGIPEVVQDGITGLLVEPRNAKALAMAMHELLTDPTRAEQMSRAAQSRDFSDFSIDALVKKTEAVYRDLLASFKNKKSS